MNNRIDGTHVSSRRVLMEKSVRAWIEGWRKLRSCVYETQHKFYPTGSCDLDVSLLISISHTPSLSHLYQTLLHSLHYSLFVNLCEAKALHLWRESDHPVERWSQMSWLDGSRWTDGRCRVGGIQLIKQRGRTNMIAYWKQGQLETVQQLLVSWCVVFDY